MRERQRLLNVMNLCRDLQAKAQYGKVTTDLNGLSFSCDLLLKNLLMMIEKEMNGESFTNELNYIKNNLLGAYSHLTGESAETVASKYNLLI